MIGGDNNNNEEENNENDYNPGTLGNQQPVSKAGTSGNSGTSTAPAGIGASGASGSSFTGNTIGASGSSGNSGSSGSSGSGNSGSSGSGNSGNSGNQKNNAAKTAVAAAAANVAVNATTNIVNNVKTNSGNSGNVAKSGNSGNAAKSGTGNGTGNGNGNGNANTGNPANTAVKGFDLVGELTFGKIITFLVVLYVLLMIGYLLSENYRVSSTLVQLDKYRNALFLDSMYLMKKKRPDKKLKDFYIASSFRPYLAINQMFEYCSLKILVRNVQNGVRAMYFDVFNDKLSEDAFPVVSSGYEKGNWKLTLNTLTFESVIRELSKTIFTSGYTNNYNDPFFIFLNLKTNRNFNSVNRIQETIYKYFKDRLLPSKYAHQSTKLADAPMRDLMGKVIIITSDGYENTNLEELVNASWNTDGMKKISYRALDAATPKSDAIKMNIDDVRTFSSSGISIVVPPEESFFTSNYYPEPFFTAGCQFIFKNYQSNDKFMEPYITKFNSSSFVDK